MRLSLLATLCALVALAQPPIQVDATVTVKADRIDYSGVQGMIDSFNKGREAARIKAETERLRAETQLIQEQTEALKRSRAQQNQSAGQPILPSAGEIVDAMNSLERIYPDYWKYADEITRLVLVFKRGNVGLEDYLEGLYLVAKYSTFSQAPLALRRNARSIGTTVLVDPRSTP